MQPSSTPSESSLGESASDKQMIKWAQNSFNQIQKEIKSISSEQIRLDKSFGLSAQKLDTVNESLSSFRLTASSELNSLGGELKAAISKLEGDQKESYRQFEKTIDRLIDDLKDSVKEVRAAQEKNSQDLVALKVSMAKWGGGLAVFVVLAGLVSALARLFM